MTGHFLLLDDDPMLRVDNPSGTTRQWGIVMATDEHELIRAWAARHDAQPATGEATESGPATLSVRDGGAGIRFNFPAAGLFRPITWDEWFQNFTRYDLMFVYDDEAAGQLRSARYRLVPRGKLRAPDNG